VELRQVRAFVEVARTGSFARAADALHLGRSALSKQIRLLETELGAPLFVRGGGQRDAQLTDAGEAFLPEAVTIVKAVDQGIEQVRGVAGPGRGHVNLVVAHGWETWPDWELLVTAFRQAHPDITQSISSAGSIADMLGSIASGAADLAVFGYVGEPTAPGVLVEELHTEPLVIMLPPGHRLAGAATVGMDELRDERWLLMPIEREIVTRLAAPHGYVPRCDIALTNPALLRPLLLAGEGIAPLTASEAPFHDPATWVPLAPTVDASVGIAYRRGYRPAGTRAVRDFLRAAFAGIEAPAPLAAEPQL
jgi:LysR family transcriptional activator of glutamate synthase operon